MRKRTSIACVAALATVAAASAQEIVREGDATYASYTPWEKARTFDANGNIARRGDQSRIMQHRPLYLTNPKAFPLPTNDWWTDALLSRWTGSLWSYPALVRAGAFGVSVAFPSYWIDNGTEMKAKSRLVFGAVGFNPSAANIDGWHDWDVELRLPDGEKSIKATLVHGSPFTWLEYDGLAPTIKIEADDGIDPGSPGVFGVSRISSGARAPEDPVDASGWLVKVGDDCYGIWASPGVRLAKGDDGAIRVTGAGAKTWISVGLLPDESAFAKLAPYASSIIRETKVEWRYDEKSSALTTIWKTRTEDLDGRAGNPVALQGFQPHHLKRTRPQFRTIDGLVWNTPRGRQRVAAGNELSIVYDFPGLLPAWARPENGDSAKSPYRAELLRRLLADYAERGRFGGDTYWGGKGLFQMAMAMMAARDMGEAEIFRKAHAKVRAAFEDWLTWTPGEKEHYFSYIPRWGGLVGEATSYDSDAFNDHHFHYGYFTWSGALLCLVDEDFKARYGGMLKLIAKDYANWDRSEKRFPMFRTFDPWAGHSFAGGIGDGAGNGQESSSEAMQGWGGLYLLGLALGDDAMRDAGIFGYVSEARGTAEYWFDRDRENIDYTRYTHPYNSNLTCHGVGWWTYFSGDPVWMHSIQWLPNSPALDYLSEDLKFAKWDYDTMWKTKHVTGWEGELGDASLGNVVLSYLQRSDPEQAAAIFDRLERGSRGVVRNADTGHLTYWATHSHLTYGELDFSVKADYPAARAFVKDGSRTLMAWNAGKKKRKVSFFDDKGHKVGELEAMPGVLTVSGRNSPTPPALPKWTGSPLSKADAAFAAYHPDEKQEAVSFTLGFRDVEIPVGGSVKLRPEARDQFGGPMKFKGVKLVEKPDFCTLRKGGILFADRAGEGDLVMSMGDRTTRLHVVARPLSEIDLARLGVASASSQENNGLAPENAVDGDPKTRWGSAHKDGEWLQVDLRSAYRVTGVELAWEAARAVDYDIEGSVDGVKWTKLSEVRGGAGGTEKPAVRPASARYVRVRGLRRNTGYGISLFRISIYSKGDK